MTPEFVGISNIAHVGSTGKAKLIAVLIPLLFSIHFFIFFISFLSFSSPFRILFSLILISQSISFSFFIYIVY